MLEDPRPLSTRRHIHGIFSGNRAIAERERLKTRKMPSTVLLWTGRTRIDENTRAYSDIRLPCSGAMRG